MKIGYLRVSTAEQKLDRQIDKLIKRCDHVYEETSSATAKHRPEYEKAIKQLKKGDVFVILDLDRAFRSAKDALNQLSYFREQGVGIEIINMNIDVDHPMGNFFYTLISGLAELERDMLSKRTKEGLEAARKRGAKLGRPRKLTDRQIKNIIKKVQSGEATYTQLAKQYGVHVSTIMRWIK